MMTIAARHGLAASDVQPARSNKLLFVIPFILLIGSFFLIVYHKTEKLSEYHDHENFRILSQVAGGINEQLNSLVQMLQYKQPDNDIKSRFGSFIGSGENNKVKYSNFSIKEGLFVASDQSLTTSASANITDMISVIPAQFSKIIIADADSRVISNVGTDAKISAFNLGEILKSGDCNNKQAAIFDKESLTCNSNYKLSKSDVMNVSLAGDTYRLYIYPFKFESDVTKPDYVTTLFLVSFVRLDSNAYLGFIKSPVVVVMLFVSMIFVWCIFKIELQSVHHPISILFSKTTIFLYFVSFSLLYSFLMSFHFSTVMEKNRMVHAKKYLNESANAIDGTLKAAISRVYSNNVVFDGLSKEPLFNLVINLNSIEFNGSFIYHIYKGFSDGYKCDGALCNIFYTSFFPGLDYVVKNKSGNVVMDRDCDVLGAREDDSRDYLCGTNVFILNNIHEAGVGGEMKYFPIEDAGMKSINFKYPYRKMLSCSERDGEIIIGKLCHYNFDSIGLNGFTQGVNFSFREVYSVPRRLDLSHRMYFKDLLNFGQKYTVDGGHLNSVQRLKNIGDGTKGTTVSVLVRGAGDRSSYVLNSDITASALDYFDPAVFDMSAFVINKQSGVVQFHNDSSLELNENVYSLDSESRDLENYIRHEPLSVNDIAMIDGSYHGQSGVYLVRGMENSDWAYIVFLPDLPVNLYEKSIFISFFAIVVIFIAVYSIAIAIWRSFFNARRFKEFLGFSKFFKTKKAMLYCFGVYVLCLSLVSVFGKDYYLLSNDGFIAFGVFLAVFFGLFVIHKNNFVAEESKWLSVAVSLSRGPLVVSLLVLVVFFLSINLHKKSQLLIENYIADGMLNFYCIRNADNQHAMRINALSNFRKVLSQGKYELSSFVPPQTRLNKSIDYSSVCPLADIKKTPNPVSSVIFDESNVFNMFSPLVGVRGYGREYIPLARSWYSEAEKINELNNAMSGISGVYFNNKVNELFFLVMFLVGVLFYFFCRIYNGYVSSVIYGKTGLKRDIAKLSNRYVSSHYKIGQASLILDIESSCCASASASAISYRDLYGQHNANRAKNDSFSVLKRKLASLHSGHSWCTYDAKLDGMRIRVDFVGNDLVVFVSEVELIFIESESEFSLYCFIVDMMEAVSKGIVQCFIFCIDGGIIQHRMSGLSWKSEHLEVNYRWLALLKNFMLSAEAIKPDCYPGVQSASDYCKVIVSPYKALVTTESDFVFLHNELKWLPELGYLDLRLSCDKNAEYDAKEKAWLLHRVSIYGTHRLPLAWLTTRAQFIYRYLWFHCTDQEKICLYFLATKGTFNPKNQTTLEALATRGLIRMSQGRIVPVNQSFAHFIRHAETEPAMVALINATEHGSWRLYKYPLTILVGLIIVAVCIVGAQSLSYVVSSIVALVALIGGVANNFSLIRNVVRAH